MFWEGVEREHGPEMGYPFEEPHCPNRITQVLLQGWFAMLHDYYNCIYYTTIPHTILTSFNPIKKHFNEVASL